MVARTTHVGWRAAAPISRRRRKMKKGILFGGALVAALALLAGFAANHELRPKRASGFLSYRVNSILDEIKANDSQRTQFNAGKMELFKDGLALKQANRALRKDLIPQ